MPKFLDVPQWYNEDGDLVTGASLDDIGNLYEHHFSFSFTASGTLGALNYATITSSSTTVSSTSYAVTLYFRGHFRNGVSTAYTSAVNLAIALYTAGYRSDASPLQVAMGNGGTALIYGTTSSSIVFVHMFWLTVISTTSALQVYYLPSSVTVASTSLSGFTCSDIVTTVL